MLLIRVLLLNCFKLIHNTGYGSDYFKNPSLDLFDLTHNCIYHQTLDAEGGH